MTFAQRLQHEKEEFARTLGELLEAQQRVVWQATQEHQDDWDDTLRAAARHLDAAVDQVEAARRVLEDGA